MKVFSSLLITLGALIVAVVSASKVDYSGHMVIRVIPKTREQVEFLQQWQHTSSIDFWDVPGKIGQSADIRVSPQSYYQVAKTLAEKDMNHNIFIEDLGKLEHQVEQEMLLRRAIFRSNGKALDLENYHSYDEIMAYLKELTALNKLKVTTKVGGVTDEGRDIVQLTISTGISNPSKRVMFFDCDIHAREWISPAVCLWMIDQLTTGYGTNSEITALVDKYDWKFVPITNPDGYVYTWSTDRLWRKNRNDNGVACRGVDINRNFAVGFGDTAGSSNSPCSETYHGAAAFSEPESAALRDLIAEDKGNLAAAISMHSYSQLWLSPNSYTRLPAKTDDYPLMEEAMTAGVNALTATNGTQYTFGPSSSTLYVASGVTSDYYYYNADVIHAYIIELRDTGRFGFELPPNQILPTAIETWNGIKAMLAVIEKQKSA